MPIGEITNVDQTIVYVEVRTETGSSYETFNGGIKGSLVIAKSGTVGEEFIAAHYFGRIKIELLPGNELIVRLCDNHNKGNIYYESHIPIRSGSVNEIIHFAFDPMPAGEYYWELEDLGVGGSYCVYQIGSTIGRAFKDGLPITDDFKSKIMYVSDTIEEKPVAVEGDKVNTTEDITSGSNVLKLESATVEYNIARQGDSVGTGDGKILTGCWYAGELN